MNSNNDLQIIIPDWPVSAAVKALTTTRLGGVSSGRYRSNNLATHVGDDIACVERNRNRLARSSQLPSEPVWLNQVHGTKILSLPNVSVEAADASYTAYKGIVCAVLTADCLPVLLTNRQGTEIAAIHAGWRGLLNGILEKSVARFQALPENMIAWLGPAISSQYFEVGDEVRTMFMEKDTQAQLAFHAAAADKWMADLYLLAKQRLANCGVAGVYGGDFCTFADEQRFYSYRRDNVCGRMATLIWLDN